MKTREYDAVLQTALIKEHQLSTAIVDNLHDECKLGYEQVVIRCISIYYIRPRRMSKNMEFRRVEPTFIIL